MKALRLCLPVTSGQRPSLKRSLDCETCCDPCWPSCRQTLDGTRRSRRLQEAQGWRVSTTRRHLGARGPTWLDHVWKKQKPPALAPLRASQAMRYLASYLDPGSTSSVTTSPHTCPAVSTASHIRLSVSTAPPIRISASITLHFRWSLKLPNFFSEEVKMPSSTETSHNGFDGQELATRWSIVGCSATYYMNCFTIRGTSFSVSPINT